MGTDGDETMETDSSGFCFRRLRLGILFRRDERGSKVHISDWTRVSWHEAVQAFDLTRLEP